MKLADDFDGDTYRSAYTVAFPECCLRVARLQEEVHIRYRHTPT